MPSTQAAASGPIGRASEVLGDQWTLLILREAFYGIRRPADFRETLGIAKNTLATRLRVLTSNGILRSAGHGEETSYSLTDKGRDLFGVLAAMMQWANTWMPSATAERHLVHRCAPGATAVITACAACGEQLHATTTRVEPAPDAITHTTHALLEQWRHQLTV